MSLNKSTLHKDAWRTFAGELIVPVLLCAYATQYYLGVAQSPKPETNLLLIGPVYWILIGCSLIFIGLRLRDTLQTVSRAAPQTDEASSEPSADPIQIGRSIAFIVLTSACVWLIPILGFTTTIAAYIALMLLALGVRSLPVLLLTPTLLAGLLWAGMELFLNLRVPTGLLF